MGPAHENRAFNFGPDTPQPPSRTPQRSALRPGGEALLARGHPRNPRPASRAVSLRASGTTKHAALLRASGTTSREGGNDERAAAHVTGRMLIAGIGNIFLGDDGFGPEVAKRLAAVSLPGWVRVADYGISGMHLAYDLADGYDSAILIDAAPRGDKPGTVTVLAPTPPPRPTLAPTPRSALAPT